MDATQGGVGRPADTSRGRWLPAFLCGVLVVGVLGGVALQVGSAEASTTAWSVVASPNPSAGGIFLNGVSCVGSKWCMAVGATSTGTLAESFNGSKWSTVRSPNPAGGTIPSLNGVSCISTSHCTAVGSSDIPGGVETLVETWNGAVWKIVSSPNGVGGRDGLNGVSCPASNRCTAVGYQALGGHNDETLAEFWNGSDWKIVPTPSPEQDTGVPSSYLQSVSCVGARDCKATGSSEIGSFIENWNGAKWTIADSPAVAPFGDSMDISCSGTNSCLAVGGTFVESWNGSDWTEKAAPSGRDDPSLEGVSCVRTTLCTAVGSVFDGTDIQTLVESWNGHTWSKLSSPNPSGSTTSLLQDVTCDVADVCTAVGYSAHGSTQNGLVESGPAT